MRAFVTGAEGFIASHVVEELVARGHSVTALVHYNSFNLQGWLGELDAKTLAGLDIVTGDIRDESFMRRAIRGHTHVAHLAALVAIPHSFIAPSSYVQTNVVGTLNVLEACRDNGVEKMVQTSTSEVYGTAQRVPMDEQHPLSGQSPYAASKIAADQLAFSFWSSFDLPVTTIRPFNCYGPRQSQRAFIPSVIVQLLADKAELELGSLTPTRDLTFVKDTASGFADVLESNKGAGEAFNMGSGFEVSMQEIVEMLVAISGKKPKVGLDASRIRPSSSEVERLWSDSRRMAETFGWEPRRGGKEGLYQGLSETYNWFRDNHKLKGYDASKYVL